MVDPKKIRSLVEIMTEHDLCELSYKGGEEEIVLKRAGARGGPEGSFPSMVYSQQMPQHSYAPQPAAPAAAPAAPAVDADAGLVAIKSPMVGTFYSTPNPDSPPFVTEGSRVSPNSVVCIVEAMKVFNEIKAEVSGTVKKVLVKNEDPVEFGQPLFMVKPD
ncbi:MAG: acetyl-CoA carboxylase biotin carboxyl carrier protein [Pseudomonadales bacterium]|nr:acetyl-CoA carboxylase biotin carboxyl carrier protein [Pseudomonadales bacterium]